jgi:hypothetical protein
MTRTCVNGACAGSCVAGALGCDGSNDTETCDSSGNWVVGTSCTSLTKTCVAGACTGSCVAGAVGCDGSNDTETCDSSGDWVVGTSCTSQTKTCVGGSCTGSCGDGVSACTGSNAPETCSAAGTWVVGTSCTTSNQTCVNGTCSGSCAPGQTQCSGLYQPQSCSSTGTWQDNGLACVNYCSKGACIPADCQGADGGIFTCGAGQSCCSSPSNFTSSCAATCGSGTYAVNCQGNTGTDECPSGTECCGTVVYDGAFGTPLSPICTTQSLTASCQTACAASPPPGTAGQCGTALAPKTYTVQMCDSAADCSGAYPKCCRMGLSLYSWCVTAAEAASASATKCD